MPPLPAAFSDYTCALFGAERYERYLLSLTEAPPASLRINPFKAIPAPAEAEEIPWCKGGYWLAQRPVYTLDPLFHAGCYYPQEAASMFLDSVLRQYVREPVVMLDLCAAPGGKSTLARAALPAGSLLYCNDPVCQRVRVLTENMQKMGHTAVVVTNSYAADYAAAGKMFDVILADVPCSGEGLFRKEPAAINEWSESAVHRCAVRQREIVRDIWPCLKDGGLFIYSTCTFNTYENEENVAWLIRELGAAPLAVDIEPTWGITGALGAADYPFPVYRFIPGMTRSEGLFLAVLRKGTTAAVPRHATPSALRIVYDGTATTEGKGIPTIADALRAENAIPSIPRVEVSEEMAVRYLRREALTLPAGTETGLVALTFRGFVLGIAKNIGQRANNLYPLAWRIRNK